MMVRMSEKVPNGRSSLRQMEKAESNSSRESESSTHLNSMDRIRPSSWDESDDDLLPDDLESSESAQFNSSDRQKLRASVVAEIHELKKQFFESLQRLKDPNYKPLESATNVTPEDRRQCPARVRRRTKSSSSLSPVLESKSRSSTEKLGGLEEVFDRVSYEILDFDPKYYLNNFFNDLRIKRISLMDPSLVVEETEDEESDWKEREQDGESTTLCSDLTCSGLNENDERFCKTFRKLSQIIEVEETKKDLEKSSGETPENLVLFSKSSKNLRENISPLPTARSRSEKNSENIAKENFKSLSFEEFGNFQKVQRPFQAQGSLSERSAKLYRNKPRDTFSFLSVKSPKPRMTSPTSLEDKNKKSVNKVVSFNSQIEKEFPQKSSSKENEKENLNLIDCMKIDLMKNPALKTPRSSDTSEQSLTARTRSGKSINSNPESPHFKVHMDSAGSLRVEDVNTPDSLKKQTGTDVESERKTGSSEDCSPRKTRRSFRKSECSTERKSDRNFQIPLESSSLESVKSSSSNELEINSSKSQKSKSTAKSPRVSKDSPCLEPMESYTVLESSRSYERPPNSRVASLERNVSHRSTKTLNLQSSRSSRSEIRKTPKTPQGKFSGYSFQQEIPTPTPDLNLPIGVTESQKSSYRSTKTSDLKNLAKCSSRKSSETSLQTKNTVTPRTNDTSFNRSKESLENQNEFEPEVWRELEKVNDITTNRSSFSICGRKISGRTQKTACRQISPHRETLSPEPYDSDTAKIDLLSGKTTRRSLESAGSSSPTKSIKFSPNSLASDERIRSDFQENYLEVANEIIPHKISAVQEDDDVKETPSSQRLKSESESDRYSERRLSIINEVSFEDLEISNDSNENEENGREQSQNSSRRDPPGRGGSGRNPRQTPANEPTQGYDGGKWNELIEKFGQSPNSSFIKKNKLPGFPHKTETTWDTVKDIVFANHEGKEKGRSDFSPTATGNKFETPERYFGYDNEVDEKEEHSENFNLVNEEHILENPVKKDIHPVQNFQNLYYVNVNERGPFKISAIGEFGDVTNWNADKSDTPDKPKDHGDGIQCDKITEIITNLEKKEKEIKTQRHLWTDLKGDFRSSKQKLEILFSELEDHVNVISTAPKTFKSDDCVSRKNEDYYSPITAIDLKNNTTSGSWGNRTKNTTEQDLSAESLECNKEETEFDWVTPRRSRSMIDLKTPPGKEKLEDVELNPNFNSSESELFERASGTSKREKESTNLNIFLARNQTQEKTSTKSKNWLNLKTFDMDKTNKKEKKIRKKRKDARSSKQKYHEYLATGKSHSSIPPLKLRNPNCLQNFYKRIISVFCLTSHSSVATSK